MCNQKSTEADTGSAGHTPAPLYIVDPDNEPHIWICREWEEDFGPFHTDTFASAEGAHVARIQYLNDGVPTKEQAMANARRIVACYNYCEGLETGFMERVLEKGVNLGILRKLVDEARLEIEEEKREERDRLNERVEELENELSKAKTLFRQVESFLKAPATKSGAEIAAEYNVWANECRMQADSIAALASAESRKAEGEEI